MWRDFILPLQAFLPVISIDCHSEHREESQCSLIYSKQMFRFAQHDNLLLVVILSIAKNLNTRQNAVNRCFAPLNMTSGMAGATLN